MMEISQYTPLFYPLGHSGDPREDKGFLLTSRIPGLGPFAELPNLLVSQAHVRRVDERVPVSTLLTPREANFLFTSAGKSFPAPSSNPPSASAKGLMVNLSESEVGQLC